VARRGWQTDLNEFRRDARSGSADLVLRATGILQGAIGDSVPTEATAYRRLLMNVGRQVIAAQPTLAGVFRLVNDLLWVAGDAPTGEAMRLRALAYLDGHYEASQADLQGVVARARQWLARYPVVMTYAHSIVVRDALLAVNERRREFEVLLSEARPGLEGQVLAYELGAGGVRVTLGVDMALFGWLPMASALVIGVDGVSLAGAMCKVGTSALLRAAAEREIPRYVLCTSSHLLPADYTLPPVLRSGEPEEIMPPARSVVIRNPYTEVAPIELVSFVITEEGRMEVPALRERLAALRVYPGLIGRQTGQQEGAAPPPTRPEAPPER
jgi:translation initiation factor 2B subunit (eIF-2B alpha/beta/delta family)